MTGDLPIQSGYRDAPPLIDLDILERLRTEVGAARFHLLLASLRSELATQGPAVATALAADASQQVETRMHALKSTARTFGAARLAHVAEALEQHMREGGSADGTAALAARLDFYIAETLAQLARAYPPGAPD